MMRPSGSHPPHAAPPPPARIATLAEGLYELAKKDIEEKTFGASTFGSGHHYRLNHCLSLQAIEAFEAEYAVQLPDDYRDFLLHIGNGGAGPYYGLLSLEEAVPTRNRSRAFLNTPFPLSHSWNPYDEDPPPGMVFDDYNDCIRGSLLLAHQGCGYYDLLVVTGPQRGQVWTDARVSDQGLHPLKLDFYGWYECWLKESLAEL